MTSASPNNASSFRFSIRSLILVTAFVSIFLSLRTSFVFQGESFSDLGEMFERRSTVEQRAVLTPQIMSIVACLYWLVSSTQIRPTPEESIRQGVKWGSYASFFTTMALLLEFLFANAAKNPMAELLMFALIALIYTVGFGVLIGAMFAGTKVVMDRFRRPKPNRSEDLFGTMFLCIAIGILRTSFFYPWGWVLWWPAFSVACVSMAYFIGSSEPLGKHNGMRPISSSLFLFPYLIFAYSVWTLQVLFSKESAFDVVNDSLIVARRLHSSEYPEGVTLICDLTAEFCDPFVIRKLDAYYPAPILDGGTLMPYELTFLVRELALQPGGRLLIHCANGHGRTGMVAAAWLIGYGFAKNVDEALEQLQKVRPGIHLRTLQRKAVEIATPQLLKISQ